MEPILFSILIGCWIFNFVFPSCCTRRYAQFETSVPILPSYRLEVCSVKGTTQPQMPIPPQSHICLGPLFSAATPSQNSMSSGSGGSSGMEKYFRAISLLSGLLERVCGAASPSGRMRSRLGSLNCCRLPRRSSRICCRLTLALCLGSDGLTTMAIWRM
jgi:hypothetical protein